MPRKSRSKSGEPVAIADTLDAIAERHNLKPASEALKPLDPPVAELPPPEHETIPPASPIRGHAEHVRPEGPRQRRPGEPGSVFTSVDGGFRLTDDGRERAFEFKDEVPPGHAEKQAMQEAGLNYRPGQKRWTTEATAATRDATDRLALQFSGKDIGRGR